MGATECIRIASGDNNHRDNVRWFQRIETLYKVHTWKLLIEVQNTKEKE